MQTADTDISQYKNTPPACGAACQALFSIYDLPLNSNMQKEDFYHIKISVYAWSTKYR
jgi:hypothetical protein